MDFDYFAALPIRSAEALDDPGEVAAALLRAAHSGGIGVFVWDIAGGRVLWNETMFQVYGLDRRTFPNQMHAWLDTLHPEDLPRVRSEVVAALKGDKPYDTLFRARGTDGGWHYIKGTAWVERDDSGRAIRMAGINQDVTDSQRLHALVDAVQRGTSVALGQSFFQSLVVALADALDVKAVFVGELLPRIGAVEAQTIALSLNGKLVDNFGYALTGSPCAEALAGRGGIYPDNVRQRFPDFKLLGDLGARSYLGVALMGADGTPIGLLGLIDDKPCSDAPLVHQLLKLFAGRAGAELERLMREEEVLRLNAELEARVAARTAELRRAMRELEAFTYSVSHDLGVPLRAVQGFAGILQDDYADRLDDAGRDYLKRTMAASDRMARLLDDLVSLSKISLRPINVGKTDLSMLANGIVADLQAQKPRPAMQFMCTPHLIVHADAGLMRILLDCLLRNAWKFTESTRDPRIELFERMHEGRREIVLRDNGIGFDPAVAKNLFSPFKGDGGVGGSGLTIAHRIVHRHHGDIRAESAPGKGADVAFWLPPAAELMVLLGEDAS
jgi:signal transduction histidine kinase